MKKKVITVIFIIIAIILLFPIPFKLKDGGSIEFRALLYTITKYHKLAPIDSDNEYIEGIGIKILGMEIYNNTKEIVIECVEDEEKVQNEINNNTSTNIQNSFVGTVLEETTTYMVVEPNQDEQERKTADKIIINYGTDHIDYLYGKGRKVVINYKGAIKETYPAQINTDSILVNGYEDFELTIEKASNTDTKKILSSTELYKDDYDYNLYYYGLDKVNVTVDNKTMSLEEALRSGKMTLDGMIIKALKDYPFPQHISYDDGGSMEFHYQDYAIVKFHTIEGKRDVYIGIPEMRIHDVNKNK